jgi:hypothetical protein
MGSHRWFQFIRAIGFSLTFLYNSSPKVKNWVSIVLSTFTYLISPLVYKSVLYHNVFLPLRLWYTHETVGVWWHLSHLALTPVLPSRPLPQLPCEHPLPLPPLFGTQYLALVKHSLQEILVHTLGLLHSVLGNLPMWDALLSLLILLLYTIFSQEDPFTPCCIGTPSAQKPYYYSGSSTCQATLFAMSFSPLLVEHLSYLILAPVSCSGPPCLFSPR